MSNFSKSMDLTSFFGHNASALEYIQKLNYSSRQLLGTMINSPGAVMKLVKDNKVVALVTAAGNWIIRTSTNMQKQSFTFAYGDLRKFISKVSEQEKGYIMVRDMQSSPVKGETGCTMISCIDLMKGIRFDEDVAFIWRVAAAKNRDYKNITFGSKNFCSLPDFGSITKRTNFDNLSLSAKEWAIRVFPQYVEYIKRTNNIDFEADIIKQQVNLAISNFTSTGGFFNDFENFEYDSNDNNDDFDDLDDLSNSFNWDDKNNFNESDNDDDPEELDFPNR